MIQLSFPELTCPFRDYEKPAPHSILFLFCPKHYGGTVIDALFGGFPKEIYGQKKTMFWIGILYLLSAIGSAIAWDPFSFSFFRFIGEIVAGASSVSIPACISEIAPYKNKGKLVPAYQFNIVSGILIAFLTNYIIGTTKGTGVHWVFAALITATTLPVIK